MLARNIGRELGWEFPEDREEQKMWIEEIIKALFGVRFDIPDTPVTELQEETLEVLKSA